MNVEELVRDSLRELAEAQPGAAPGFAERVLRARRRRRARRLAALVSAGAAVVAVAVAAPLLPGGRGEPYPVAAGYGDSAHADQSPPRELIAAGDTALAAYYRIRTVQVSERQSVVQRTYWLLDPVSGRYEKDARWSVVAVAPGLRTAAVLERKLPASRIGLLDLRTREVERWIPVDHAVGGLEFSNDATKLVATTYERHPDPYAPSDTDVEGGYVLPPPDPRRSGFHVLDVASGQGSWSAVADRDDDLGRQDFAFGRDGRTVYCQVIGARDGLQQFYDLHGRPRAAPAGERHLRSDVPARLSPDGRLAALGLSEELPPGRSYSSILDPRTGDEVAKVRGAQLLAWADDRRLIAWERVTGLDEPYRPRLVLVTIGSDETVPLSGVSEQGRYPFEDTWTPVFARR
ncbi:WD40 repeat domain-containing protein [Streptomyces sp. NPDC006458]|uniref:WD40 repeat domain-containing protein n=1 Tax=Streptomyces sp. NPDC006458 TaxID=3154302 RepID=UPI0033B42DCA